MATEVNMATLPDSVVPVPSGDWRGMLRFGYIVLLGGLGLFVLWATFTRLDAAAIAPGVVQSESNRKTIQHLEGGIVQEILVRDGDQVTLGQVLVRLDPTRLDTQGDLYGNQMTILLAQEARLRAEFEGRERIEFPPDVMRRADDAAIRSVIDDQSRLFASRRDAVTRNIGIADAQIEQARRELEQSRSDITTGQAMLEQVTTEVDNLVPLFKRGLVPVTRMAPLEREKLRLTGVVANGQIQIQKLQEKLGELTLRRDQVLQDYRQEASTLLVDVRKQISDVRQQILLTADLQKRSEIRAPLAGAVQQLRIFTVGGVIRPGDPILDIVPANDELVIRARVDPNDAERVSDGMAAEIRFPAFAYWGNKVIRGKVRSISRDRILDPNGRDVYFAAEVLVDKLTLPQEIQDKLSAGLTADVIITTGERTVANYLLRPLTERLYRSMREN